MKTLLCLKSHNLWWWRHSEFPQDDVTFSFQFQIECSFRNFNMTSSSKVMRYWIQQGFHGFFLVLWYLITCDDDVILTVTMTSHIQFSISNRMLVSKFQYDVIVTSYVILNTTGFSWVLPSSLISHNLWRWRHIDDNDDVTNLVFNFESNARFKISVWRHHHKLWELKEQGGTQENPVVLNIA